MAIDLTQMWEMAGSRDWSPFGDENFCKVIDSKKQSHEWVGLCERVGIVQGPRVMPTRVNKVGKSGNMKINFSRYGQMVNLVYIR